MVFKKLFGSSSLLLLKLVEMNLNNVLIVKDGFHWVMSHFSKWVEYSCHDHDSWAWGRESSLKVNCLQSVNSNYGNLLLALI